MEAVEVATQAAKLSHSKMETSVHHLTRWMGSTFAVALILIMIAVWLSTRPLFSSRQDWQDLATVPVTLLTFLFIFILQRSQNKAILALQLKLNEIIAAQHGASNRLIGLENLSESEVHAMHTHYTSLGEMSKTEENPGQVHSIEEMTSGSEQASKP